MRETVLASETRLRPPSLKLILTIPPTLTDLSGNVAPATSGKVAPAASGKVAPPPTYTGIVRFV